MAAAGARPYQCGTNTETGWRGEFKLLVWHNLFVNPVLMQFFGV
jgi:hypothetical protein